MPAQTRACSPFLNLRTSSWQRRSSLMTLAETWDSWDEIWQVCDVTTATFTATTYSCFFSVKTCRVMNIYNFLPLSIYYIRRLHTFPKTWNPLCADRRWASASMWLGDLNSLALWSFCCVFLFENLSQPVKLYHCDFCVALQRFPQTKSRPSLASFFLRHPSPPPHPTTHHPGFPSRAPAIE